MGRSRAVSMAAGLVLMAASGGVAALAWYDGEIAALPIAQAAGREGREVTVKGWVVASDAQTLDVLDDLLALYEAHSGERLPSPLALSPRDDLFLLSAGKPGEASEGIAYAVVRERFATPEQGSSLVVTGRVVDSLELVFEDLGLVASVAVIDPGRYHAPLLFA